MFKFVDDFQRDRYCKGAIIIEICKNVQLEVWFSTEVDWQTSFNSMGDHKPNVAGFILLALVF